MSNPSEHSRQTLPLAMQIQSAGLALANDHSQKAAWRFITLLQRAAAEEMPLYIPVHTAQSSLADSIEPLDLSLYVIPDRDLYQKVELEDGHLAYTAFLSLPGEDAGDSVEYRSVPAGALFATAYNDRDIQRVILDPWSLSAMLTDELLSLILNVDGTSAQSSLFIAQGEAVDQPVDVIVSVADHPFEAIEPGPASVFAAGGKQLADLVAQMEEPIPGHIAVCDAFIRNASVIFHVALPRELSEETLRALIEEILSLAERMGFSSIALPAIGNEEAPIEKLMPFALLAASGWLSRHPLSGLAITITVRNPLLCKAFAASADELQT